MKIIFTGIIGLLLFLNGYSQSFNNDNEAIAFMNSHQATYSFEGIYEIYIRFGFFSVLAQQRAGGNDETRNEEMVKQKFESKGKKVCIYYSNNHFYLRPIGGINEKLYYENALNESLYTIDNFGIITFQQISKAEDNITNKEIRETVKVEQSDNGLFLDLFYGPKEIKLTTGEKDIWAYRAHILFKKIYAPNKTPNVGSASFGSGFLISNKGYVVTNYHVIEGS